MKTDLADAGIAGVRRRLTRTLFGAVALGTTGLFASITVAPIVADEIMGMQALSGMPSAAAIAGTAVGAMWLSRVMAGRGRRAGLVLGFGVAVAGAVVALAAAALDIFALFVLGMLAVGCGNSAALLGRFAAADSYPEERRASAIGLVIWAGTVGAVAGPAVVDPSARLASSVGLPALGGALAAAAIAFGLAALLAWGRLRPDPSALAGRDGEASGLPSIVPAGAGELRGAWRTPRVQVAVAAMVAGQFVMVLIMTMTPVHIRHAGHGLAQVSIVMSAHVLGMYALTPVAGRLADRLGHLRIIFAGLLMLAVAGVVAAVSPADNQGLLTAALFLLGVGWSFGFVAASGLLARGASFAERARLQGSADSFVFAAATVASLSSGFLIASVGYVVLCFIGAAFVAVPAAVVLRNRRAVRLELASA